MWKKIVRKFTGRQPVTYKERKRLFFRDSGRCRYCNCKLDFNDFHLDHVIPYSWGGVNFNNLVCSCKPCNIRKGANRWTPRKISKVRSIISILFYPSLPRFKDFI